LRGVLRECWRPGYVNVEEYQRATDLEPIRGSRLPRGRALQTGELEALFDDCASDRRSATATRDAALLALLYGSGVRRAELVALDLADHDRQAGALKIRGNGNKQRLDELIASRRRTGARLGQAARRRLNRGGDGRANSALHMVACNRSYFDRCA
jgi:site-specific recombinase XerD